MEAVAAVAGIVSVYFSRKENILVYPVGLVNTLFYTWISFNSHLIGEAAVNLYYTGMSIWGWYLWSRKTTEAKPVMRITFSNSRDMAAQLLFFGGLYLVIYLLLAFLKKGFAEGAIPWADALASASAFTGMYLMAKKKVESWYWWIITNIVSIPLYFVKNLEVTSLYFFILLIMAFSGLMAWRKKALHPHGY